MVQSLWPAVSIPLCLRVTQALCLVVLLSLRVGMTPAVPRGFSQRECEPVAVAATQISSTFGGFWKKVPLDREVR